MNSYHYLANFLDPRFRGRNLTKEQKDECEVTVLNYAKLCLITEYNFFEAQDLLRPQASKTKALVTAFQLFREWKGKFASPFYSLNDHQTVKEWWSQFLSDAEYQSLALVAISLFSIPISAAAIERTFSDYKNQHTKKRNQIQSEKVQKIITIIQNDRAQRVSEAEEFSPVYSNRDCDFSDSDNVIELSIDDFVVVTDDELM